MSVFGHLCLVGTALCLLGLLNLAILQKAPGGDAGVGHAWAIVLAWAAVHLNDGLARALPTGAATALTLGVVALSSLPLVGMGVGSAARNLAGFAQRGELDSFQQGIATASATARARARWWAWAGSR